VVPDLAALVAACISRVFRPFAARVARLPLAWNTYHGYYRVLELPAQARYAGRIKLAGAPGFYLPPPGRVGLSIPSLHNGSGSAGDNAGFARSGDLHMAARTDTWLIQDA